MRENAISGEVVDAAICVHRALGPGLLESVYGAALAYELRKRGLFVERELPLPVFYDGVDMGLGLRVDLLVERRVLVELKSVEKLAPIHSKQVLSYLKLGGWRVGLLVNFNMERVKDGIVRIANGIPDNVCPSAASAPSA